MSLADIYHLWRRKAKQPITRLFDYNFVRMAIDDAVACCNDKEGPEFIQGLVAGHMPLSHAVGGDLQYFDTLVEYARQTQDDPENRLQVLNDIATKLYRVPGCGFKFLMAQLVLAYGCLNKYPAGESLATNVIRHTGLMAEATELLELFSRYSPSEN
jgi:hypothetical protein